MNDLEPDPEEISATVAYDQSFTFNGQKLEPFSFARQAAALRLGMSSASLFESATLLVFLCTQPWEKIDAARGKEEQAEFRRAMSEWADANKINFTSPNGAEVIRIANEIWAGLAASESEPNLPDAGTSTPDPKAQRRAKPRIMSRSARQSLKAA